MGGPAVRELGTSCTRACSEDSPGVHRPVSGPWTPPFQCKSTRRSPDSRERHSMGKTDKTQATYE